MQNNEIRNSMKQTLTTLKLAEHEMNRPKEDVVAISVCFRIRQSMNTMMRLYLLSKGISLANGLSLCDLLKQCQGQDEEFSVINLTTVLCNKFSYGECEGRYCLATEKVTECIEVANCLKSLVLEKLMLNETD